MPYLGKQPVNVIKNNAVSTDTIVDDAVTNAKVAPSAINTAELADNAVQTAKINANAVTDAKLNDNAVTTNKIVDLNVTQGKLASEAVSEAKLHVGNVPTNNYVLTADSGQPGGLTWASPSAVSGFIPLVTTNITTATAGVEFTLSSYSSTYDNFFVTIHNLAASGSNDMFKVLFLRTGQTTYISGDVYKMTQDTTNGFNHSTGVGSFIFQQSGDSGDTDETHSVTGYLFDMHSTINSKQVRHFSQGYSAFSNLSSNQTTSTSAVDFGNAQSSRTAMQKVKYQWQSSNIVTGTFTLYGMSKV